MTAAPRTPAYRPPAYVSGVAAAIMARIRERGLTARELADLAGVDRQAAQRAVRGHHLGPRNLDAVMQALGLVTRAAEE